MNISQIEYGDERIEEISKKWKVSKETAVKILLDISTLKDFWKWVNAETYLYNVLYPKNIKLS